MKSAFGFLHAGEASRAAAAGLLERKGLADRAVHLVDPALVDASAREFTIDDERYAKILHRARQLAGDAERIVLSCSVYNGVVPWLRDDLGIDVQRSDAAAARTLVATTGTIGVLLSFPPSRPVVVDYLSEVLAQAEQSREIRSSVTQDAPPFATSADTYRAALLEALRPLRDCDVLLLSQFSMEPYVDEIRAQWGERPLISAAQAAIDALTTS